MVLSRLVFSKAGHIARIVTDLISRGWTIDSLPLGGKMPSNRALVVLREGEKEIRIRVSAYTVTGSSRSKPHERRVEITTTYGSGLIQRRDLSDIVLGVDTTSNKYVGIDSRRLKLGGNEHNSSSFFDLDGLSVKKGGLVIKPRAVANSFFANGIEHHAFYDSSRLAEYLFSQSEIHAGDYAYTGVMVSSKLSGRGLAALLTKSYPTRGDWLVLHGTGVERRPSRTVDRKLLIAAEDQDLSRLRRKISPEELRKVRDFCDEIGALGEQAVLAAERTRLTRLGHSASARLVRRVSLQSVSEGYDILSFEDDGVTRRYLEVKATVGEGRMVNVSLGEWKAARHYGPRYYIVRVTQAQAPRPNIYYVCNPVRLEQAGKVSKSPAGWLVDLRSEIGP